MSGPARTRVFPSTTSILATGICGHDFKRRIALPSASVGGQERTPSREEELAVFVAQWAAELARQPCTDCACVETRLYAEQTAGSVTAAYGLAPLPAMLGSLKATAFAEELRAHWLREQSELITQTVWAAFTNPSLGLALLLSTVSERFVPMGPCSGVDVQELQVAADRRAPGRRPAAGDDSFEDGVQIWLAIWILMRRRAGELTDRLYEALDAPSWVRSARFKNRNFSVLRVLPIDFEDLVAALLVAKTGGWQQREDAERAFLSLRHPSTSGDLDTLRNSAEMPLGDALMQVDVIRALIRESDHVGAASGPTILF